MHRSDLVVINRKNIALWFLLAFQAGAINAGGFLAFHRFVTHTTGFATHFGVEFAQKNYSSAFGMLTVPLFFLLGAMISAYFVDIRFQTDRPPNYRIPVTFIALIMILAAIGGQFGWYGSFEDPFVISRDYGLMVMLTMASGLQNALICNAQGAAVRTTHLTGLSTDLAIGLSRVLFHRNQFFRIEAKKVVFAKAGTIFCFVLGSLLSALIFLKMHYGGFWVPVVSSCILWRYAFR